ncbi:MAG: hypothetical protein Q8L34_01350 [Candidatus Woesearchaeota archaeon]|nr:hypothetical protein [Candidatus Woesearchaeota archaeon]
MTHTNKETMKIFNERGIPIEQALENCLNANYRPLFMPHLADARINGQIPWDQKGISTPSIRITGQTKQGSQVVVYVHTPTSLATPEGIKAAKQRGLSGWQDGAARFPQEEFQSLVNQDGKTDVQSNRLIWVVDYNSLQKAPYGPIFYLDALVHPHTIPFLGGQERAELYLAALQKAEGPVGIDMSCRSDPIHHESPLARFLYLGYREFINHELEVTWNHSLIADFHLKRYGTFLGVRSTTTGEASK